MNPVFYTQPNQHVFISQTPVLQVRGNQLLRSQLSATYTYLFQCDKTSVSSIIIHFLQSFTTAMLLSIINNITFI